MLKVARARGQDVRGSEHTLRLIAVKRQVSLKLEAAEGGMAACFQGEAPGIREVLQQTAATVLECRRISKRVRWILAGTVLLGVLSCIAAGLWLQGELESVPPPDTTDGS